MVAVKDVIKIIENFAPLSYQETYDNSGLQVGNVNDSVSGVLLCLDVTEDVIDEAIATGANLVISHHPLIFGGLKRLTGATFVERTIIKALKGGISIYSCHTNADNVWQGVNFKIAEKLGLGQVKVLRPVANNLCKLVTFVPNDHAAAVREALFGAGAGHIGNYDCCSYNLAGEGTFRAGEGANPFVGTKNKIHHEPETRIETIFPKFLERAVVSALLGAHPYEEVAYDIYPLLNNQANAGAGVIGELETPVEAISFLKALKSVFDMPVVRHTEIVNWQVQRIALCGGIGSFLLSDAKRAKADVFVTADVKYHQFFDAEKSILLADIGHYESEQFTIEIFYDLLVKNFPNFAVRFTKVKTNPINYF